MTEQELNDHISAQLRSYYPNSRRINTTLTWEMTLFFQKHGGEAAFDAALAKHRDGAKGNFCPMTKELKDLTPKSGGNYERKIIFGWPNDHPHYQEALKLYSRAQWSDWAKFSMFHVSGIAGGYPLGVWENVLKWAEREDAAKAERAKKYNTGSSKLSEYFRRLAEQTKKVGPMMLCVG